jgi:tellurite resistance protein
MTLSKKNPCRFKHFPVSFFSTILGLAGFTIASQKFEHLFLPNAFLSTVILTFTVLVFVLLSIFYSYKILKFKNEVKEEFDSPIKINFFPTFSISILLLSIAFLDVNLIISRYFWIIGAILHFIFTIKIVSIWIQHSKFEITHMNPAWFVPAVGNILVPVSGVTHASPEISWFFYSIGLLFWIILLVIFFNRIIFHNPLPQKLLPTLFILIAPPAVGFISYIKLTENINEFSKFLYYFALFLVFLLFFQWKLFYKIKFYLSWWAYSFPIAAITIASFLMFKGTNFLAFKFIFIGLYVILSIIISFLLIKTIIQIKNKAICVEED